MKKRMFIMLVIVIIVFGGIVGFYFFKQAMMQKFFSHFAPPPATVTTQTVSAVTWHPYLSSVGTLQAEQSIEVSPEIGGKVIAIHFQSGDVVQKGAPLVDLDTSTQQAQLNADQAKLQLAQITYKRNLVLSKRNVLSQSDLDSSLSDLQGAQAAVEGDLAIIKKMHIVAPFAGKLGIREVSLGQYIAPPPATGNIVPLSTIDPMLVQFSLSQQELPQIKMGQAIQLTIDAYPGKIFKGTISATNADVAQSSRTILVQAKVANTDQSLLAGMFANVRILLPAQSKVITVPQTAIVYSLYGNSVYVVNKDNSVTQTFVTLGQAEGINVAIEKGLTIGDTIVTSGQLKLHNGSKILVNNKVLPD